MLSLLDAIGESGWAVFLKEANTVWGYPTVLVLHTYGMIFVVGISAALALRTIGYASEIPLASLRKYVPLMWAGFCLNLLSGTALFLLDGRNFATMPAMWIKLTAVAVAVVYSVRLVGRVLGSPTAQSSLSVSPEGRRLGYTVLLAWAIAVTAGRVTAYDGLVQTQTAVAVVLFAVVVLAVVAVTLRRTSSEPVERRGRVAT